MAFTDGYGRDLSASLDRWITGNYGEDQYADAVFCECCLHWRGGICGNQQSEFHTRPTDAEDTCENAEQADPTGDEPQDFDERRDRDV